MLGTTFFWYEINFIAENETSVTLETKFSSHKETLWTQKLRIVSKSQIWQPLARDEISFVPESVNLETKFILSRRISSLNP